MPPRPHWFICMHQSRIANSRKACFISLVAMLQLSGCAQIHQSASHNTIEKAAVTHHLQHKVAATENPGPDLLDQQAPPTLKTPPATQLQPGLKLTSRLPAVANPTDPLLSGVRPDDIARAKVIARRHWQRSWTTIRQRSQFVRSRLLEALRKLHAPVSLQVIPVVESTYNPYALSMTGAAGLWQLMPATARSLGVHSSRHIDGRRHIADSTTAAVRYLQQLQRRFNSWPLALAAYNIGPNALAHRLKKHPWSPENGLHRMPVPAATRQYVQYIIGLTALLQDNTFSFPPPVKTRELLVQAPIDIHRLAQISGMSENAIFRFNPCLNQAQYLRHTVTIHVPANRYETVRAKLAHAGPKYISIKVGKGDSLWRIAKNNHTTIATLKFLNRGVGRYLHIGQKLKLPANRLARASADRNPLLTTGRRIRYRVRSGDSLWRIAHRFGTTPHAIARANRISTKRMIRAGDTLWVYAGQRPS